ncbi:hypothetical protein ACLKA7_011057 [Drosophila subpalustris]
MDATAKIKEELHAILEDRNNENNQNNICSYLENLQDRLKQTVRQHSEIIQSSVSLIKELGDVSTMLAMTQSGSDLHATKIKRLIVEFENLQSGDNSQGLSSRDVSNLRSIIADYQRLDESHLLQDSLMCFKLAKDSLEKVETLMNQLSATGWECAQSSQQSSHKLTDSQSASRSLREKIRAFNKASEQGKNPLQNFTLCFSSNSSTDIPSGDDIKPVADETRSRTNSGYEGDIDSEVDQVGETIQE